MLPINLGHFCKTCISSPLLSWSRLSKRFSQHYMLLALVFPQSWKINSYWWRKYKLYKQLRDLCAGTVLTAPSLTTSFPGSGKCYACFQRRESKDSLIQQWYFWTKQQQSYSAMILTDHNKEQHGTITIRMLGLCTYPSGN